MLKKIKKKAASDAWTDFYNSRSKNTNGSVSVSDSALRAMLTSVVATGVLAKSVNQMGLSKLKAFGLKSGIIAAGLYTGGKLSSKVNQKANAKSVAETKKRFDPKTNDLNEAFKKKMSKEYVDSYSNSMKAIIEIDKFERRQKTPDIQAYDDFRKYIKQKYGYNYT